MKRFRFLLLLILSFTLVTPAGWASPDEVYVARVEGIIAPSLADFFVSAIRKAEDGAAHAIVFELDTPGALDTSMRIIIKKILRSPAPVIIYVSPSGARAASAGAFITIAAHVAAMAPRTHTGAAPLAQT